MTKYNNDSVLFLEHFLKIFPNFISHLFRLYDVCRIRNIAALYFISFFLFFARSRNIIARALLAEARADSAWCIDNTAWESAGWSGARAEREMLLDRNLSSVVRDAPYAVDHLSARSQRPIISRDTCASPPIKSVTCYVSHRRLWRRFFRNARQRNFGRRSVRIVYRTRDSRVEQSPCVRIAPILIVFWY